MIMLLLYNPELNIFRLTIGKAIRAYTEAQLTTIKKSFQDVGGQLDISGWSRKARANPNVDIMYCPT